MKIYYSDYNATTGTKGTSRTDFGNASFNDLLANSVDYSAVTSYTVGQTVLNQGVVWRCILASTGNAPPTLPVSANTYWEYVGSQGTFTWIAYASNSTGTTDFTTGAYDQGGIIRKYIGVAYNKPNTNESSIPSDYAWAKFIGDDGVTPASPITVALSKPAIAVPTDSDGNNGVYTGTGTLIYVSEGQTVLTFNGAGTSGTGNATGGTTNSTWRVSSRAATNVSLGTISTGSGGSASIGDASNLTADTGSIVYTLTGKTSAGDSFTITATQTFSKVKGAVIDVLAPNPPTALALSSSTETLPGGNSIAKVKASWSAPTTNTDSSALTDLSYYDVQIKSTSSPLGEVEWIEYKTSNLTQEWTVTPNSSYIVRVRAVDKNENKSAFDYVGTSTSEASTVTGVNIGASGLFTCTSTPLAVNQPMYLSGILGTATISGYSSPKAYYIKTTNGTTSFTLSETVGGPTVSTTSGTIGSLIVSKRLSYIIAAKDTVPPGVPQSPTATATFKTIYLEWTNPTDDDLASINIYESSNNTTYTLIASVPASSINTKGNYSRTGLPSGTQRYYKLEAVDTSNNVSSQTSAISATTAKLATGDIGGAAIDALEMFAGGIEPVSVVPGSTIPTTKTSTSIILEGTGKLYRWDGTQYTAAVDGQDIVANSITAGQISAGAIGATQIAANSITTDKLIITGSNVIPNSDFASGDFTNWRPYTNTSYQSVIAGSILTTGMSGTGSVATLTFAAQPFVPFSVGDSITVSGAAPAGYNGTFTITAVTNSSVSYSSTATGAQTTAATITEFNSNALATIPTKNVVKYAYSGAALNINTFSHQKAYNSNGADQDGFAVEEGEEYSVAIYLLKSTSFASTTGVRLSGYFYTSDGDYTTNRVCNVTPVLQTLTASGNGTTATITFQTQSAAPYAVGDTIRVSGVAPSGYNGTYIVTAASTSSVSFSSTATGAQTVSGTIALLSGAYKINTIPASDISSTNWTQFIGKFTVPANATRCWLYVNDMGHTAGKVYWTKLRAIRRNSSQLIVDGSITTSSMNANTIDGQVIQTNTLHADKIITTSLTADRIQVPASGGLNPAIQVGSTGIGIGNPIGLIENSPSATKISPGNILISGATTLSDWRGGASNTEINGGAIAADTITANKITIGSRGVTITGIVFTASSTTNITWTGGTINYLNDSGNSVTVTIAAQVSAVTRTATNTVYLYWIKGGTSILNTTSLGTATGSDRILLATWVASSTSVNANYGRTVIDGSSIVTGSITSNQIQTGSITADRIDSRGLTIKDTSGNVIFAAGTPLAWTNISTTELPSTVDNGQSGINIANPAYSEFKQTVMPTISTSGSTGTFSASLDPYVSGFPLLNVGSIKLTTGAASTCYVVLGSALTAPNIALKPSTTYMYSAYVKASVASSSAQLRIRLDDAGVDTTGSFTTSATANTWTRVSFTFTTNATTTSAVARLGSPTSSNNLWFSGIMIEEARGSSVSTPSPYAPPALMGQITSSTTSTYIASLNADVITAGTINTDRLTIDGISLSKDPGTGSLRVKALGIDTGFIADNAVSTLLSAYTSSSISCPENATTTIQTRSITTTGKPVQISIAFTAVTGTAPAYVSASIYRDSTVIWTSAAFYVASNGGFSLPLSYQIVDDPGTTPATYSYTLRAYVSAVPTAGSPVVSATGRTLTVLELKR